jgi:hypothetical protein
MVKGHSLLVYTELILPGQASTFTPKEGIAQL